MPSLTCPKCQAQMQEGFIPELGHLNNLMASRWSAGAPPEPRLLVQFLFRPSYNKMPPVVTYRCPACGYLESYARQAAPR
ncbi:MAG TPA: hypothetical protein VJA16_11260 [Thermoanaerobaculia bacterium]